MTASWISMLRMSVGRPPILVRCLALLLGDQVTRRWAIMKLYNDVWLAAARGNIFYARGLWTDTVLVEMALNEWDEARRRRLI